MNFFFSFLSPKTRSLISVLSPSQLTIPQRSSKNQQSLGHKKSQLHNQKKKKNLINLSSLLPKCDCSSFRDILHGPFSPLVPVEKMFSALSNYSLTLPGEKSCFLQFTWLSEVGAFVFNLYDKTYLFCHYYLVLLLPVVLASV